MENYHLSIHMAFWKESMINRLSNLINCNRSAAKILQVLCSNMHALIQVQEQMQPMRLCILKGRQVEETHTKTQSFHQSSAITFMKH